MWQSIALPGGYRALVHFRAAEPSHLRGASDGAFCAKEIHSLKVCALGEAHQ